MKTNLVTVFIVVSTFGGLASSLAQTRIPSERPITVGAPTNSGARIQFAETLFDFGTLKGGDVARHDFVFTNTGSSTLEIKDVRPGCGCTTAGTWDKVVEPGKTGIIPLQFNSTGFSGPVRKSATVTCNDPGKSNLVLELKSTVWRPIDVTPSMAMFHLSSENQTNETRVVRIVSNLDEPVELSDLQCTNRAFQAELKTVRPGKEFALHITAVPPFNSPSINAPLTLKTSSPKMPTINVSAYLMVQQEVMVTPVQITLHQAPLTNAMQRVVTVRNTGTDLLVLSEPRLSVPGAEVRMQEIQPGRFFNITVDFPVGFQTQGQKVEVTAKSNHPRFPLITVPIIQQAPIASAATSLVPAKPSTVATEK